VHTLKRTLWRHVRTLGRALYCAGPGFCSRHPRQNLGSGRAQLVDRRGLCRSGGTFWNRASHDPGVDPIQHCSALYPARSRCDTRRSAASDRVDLEMSLCHKPFIF
jgi:hypothetical protein